MEHEALVASPVEREALERELEQHRLVLQEVELLAGHPRTALEVDQVELRPEAEMVQRLEVEAPGLAPAT